MGLRYLIQKDSKNCGGNCGGDGEGGPSNCERMQTGESGLISMQTFAYNFFN